MSQLAASLYNWNKKILTMLGVVFISFFTAYAFLKLSISKFIMFISLYAFPFLFFNAAKYLNLMLGIFTIFPSIGYGVKEGVWYFNIYGKGAGTLPFPLVTSLLFLMLASGFFGLILNPNREHRKFQFVDFANLLMFATVFIYVAVAYITIPPGPGKFFKAFSHLGVLGIGKYCFMYFSLYLIVKDGDHLERIMKFMFCTIMLRACYGFVRFLFFGGDVANIYANYDGANIKLTFFDIYDSAFCVFVFAFSYCKIFIEKNKSNVFKFAAFITLFDIVFSFRRTAWGGLILAMTYLFTKMNRKQKRFFLTLVIASIPLIIVLGSLRFGDTTGGITKDLSLDFSSSASMGRFGEMYYAFRSIKESPLLGLGSYSFYQSPSYHYWSETTEFVHSAVVHIFFKMGLVGLIIFSMIVIGAIQQRETEHIKNLQPSNLKFMYYAAWSGLLFVLPDFVFGTPIIEIRHIVGMAIFLGILRLAKEFLEKKQNVSEPKVVSV